MVYEFGFFKILDPILNPLLSLPPLLGIIIISFIISLLITLVCKYFTDQELLKSLKEKIKKHQEEMKKHKENPEKMMKIQKDAMQVNMKYMMHSMRSTIITFLPIILIFGWMSSNLGYEPISYDEEFNVTAYFTSEDITRASLDIMPKNDFILMTGKNQLVEENIAKWKLKSPTKEKCIMDPCVYTLIIKTNNNTYDKEIQISEIKYKNPEQSFNNKEIIIKISNKRIEPLKMLPIPWVKNWGWLGSYILFSLIFSLGLKKVLKVY